MFREVTDRLQVGVKLEKAKPPIGKQINYEISAACFSRNFGTLVITDYKKKDHGVDVKLKAVFLSEWDKDRYEKLARMRAKEFDVNIKQFLCKKTVKFTPLPRNYLDCEIEAEAPNLNAVEDTFGFKYDLFARKFVEWKQLRKELLENC